MPLAPVSEMTGQNHWSRWQSSSGL